MFKKLLLLFALLVPQLTFADPQIDPNSLIWHEKGLVREVQTEDLGEESKKQNLTVEILAGPSRGQTITTTNFWNGGQREILVEEGDKVLVYAETNMQGGTDYSIRDYWRFDGLVFWVLLFVLLTFAITRWKGLKGVLALVLSIVIIFWFFLPMVRDGGDPLLYTLLVSIFIILVNVPLIHGWNKKSLAISLATAGAVVVTIGITLLIDHFLRVKGTGAEETIYLTGGLAEWQSLPKIFAAGVILGALGAVMDVCVSIASGLWEVTQHKASTFKKLLASGMNIGGDVLGSMLNTLIFAYVGSSLVMLLVLAQGEIALLPLLNFSFIVEELVRALIGAFGLLLAIPLTAVIAALLLEKRK